MWRLVPTAGVAGAWSPVDDDEAEAHYHKQEANPSKAGSLEEREAWLTWLESVLTWITLWAVTSISLRTVCESFFF